MKARPEACAYETRGAPLSASIAGAGALVGVAGVAGGAGLATRGALRFLGVPLRRRCMALRNALVVIGYPLFVIRLAISG